jgi:hypothetical protein
MGDISMQQRRKHAAAERCAHVACDELPQHATHRSGLGLLALGLAAGLDAPFSAAGAADACALAVLSAGAGTPCGGTASTSSWRM